ncbi:hypothetical protein BC629DRAFT_1437671 [Irpex lacteus]|nr:hypothetical protein BC629DRAFT_1437671 [Irpex lacteus]
MRSLDTTITPFGTIFEEPETYGTASPELTDDVRPRRTTSWTSLDGSTSTTMSAGRGPLVPAWDEYRRKSYSTMSIPAQKLDCVRRFSTLSDPFPKFVGERAAPMHEEVTPSKISKQPEEIKGFDRAACPGVMPSDVMQKRYMRLYHIPQKYDENSTTRIKALQTSFRPLSISPSNINGQRFNWESCKSPEGNLYFREASKRVLTCVDMYDEILREAVAKCALYILQRLEEESQEEHTKRGENSVPPDTEVIVMLEDFGDGGDYGYGYYLASWTKRCVFWLEDMEYDIVTTGTRVCVTESHIGQYVELLFWYVDKGQTHIPQDMVEALKDVLTLGAYDHITSNASIFPYDKTDASDILRCLDRVKREDSPDNKIPGSSRQSAIDIWVVANYSFLNYHGERGARIHRDDSVKQETVHGKRSLLFKLVNPFLFWMPSVYMKEIENVWIDESVDWISWRKFTTLIYKDWNQSMTPATVILSANVGFLAINSIDTGDEDRTAAQIASYISSVLSFFFFITVQVLTHQHRSSDYFTPSTAPSNCALHLEVTINSMLTFLGALMIVFFWHTSIVTRVLMGTVTVILLVVTAVLLWLDWNNHSANEDGHAGRQGTILYYLCPSGLRQTLLNVREKWQHKGRFILRRKSSSISMVSVVSGSRASTATMVGSP